MWQDEGDATSAMYGVFNKFRATFSTGYIYWENIEPVFGQTV